MGQTTELLTKIAAIISKMKPDELEKHEFTISDSAIICKVHGYDCPAVKIKF